MSSAQIANMFNEATILTVRYQQKAISQAILLEAFDRVLMGPALKSQALTPETKKLVAYHEAGHAVVVDLREKEDDTLVNKREILAQIMSFLGGRISEELVFGTSYVTTGNYSDYKRVSELARDLILRYSMSDLGIIASQDSPFFVRQILQEKRKVLDLLAQTLIEKNTLHREEIYYIFINETKIGIVFFAAFFTTIAFTLLLKPNGIYNSGLNGFLQAIFNLLTGYSEKVRAYNTQFLFGFGREQLGFTLPFYVTIALLAALIHTYGYSLIFRARATPENYKTKRSLEDKNFELEEDIKKESNPEIKQTKEQKIHQEQQKILTLQKKNALLTTHLKIKTGSNFLEEYPKEEIDMYLMNKEELKNTLEKEISKREQEIISTDNKRVKKYLIYLKKRQERTEKEIYEKTPMGYLKGYVKYVSNNEKL
ncbi:9293_t:CDS:2 [Entrophospora sp. SA101]|nr:9293_t:CDS:2 [Entrophospora sp. SA101]